MSDHKWRKDADGAESCAREGCSVRRYLKGCGITWQVKKRTHWFQSSLTPIPPCSGKEAEACTLGADVYLRPKPAPSPLEVVRQCLVDLRNMAAIGNGRRAHMEEAKANAALATLEESIRADEREACAQVADARGAHHGRLQTQMESAVMQSAEREAAAACEDVAQRIRNRRK